MMASRPGRGADDRVRLANALHAARKAAKLTGTRTGELAGMSQSKLSKIERQFLLPTVDDVTALCDVYGVDPSQREDLIALAAGLRQEASTRVTLARSPVEIQKRIGELEASTQTMRAFQPAMVFGLLQTEAYQRLVFGIPDSQALTPDEVDQAVAVRTQRQAGLDDPSKEFVLIMTEGSLRWQAGSPAVMAEQLDHIVTAAKRPNVRVGLIPWTTPVDVFPGHGFHLYDDHAAIVATETATAIITGAADLTAYRELFDTLERLASFGETAAEHIARVAAEYRTVGSQ